MISIAILVGIAAVTILGVRATTAIFRDAERAGHDRWETCMFCSAPRSDV